MVFKMKGFPTHNTSALKQKSAFKQGDPADMEAMMGMMGGGAAPEGAPVEGEAAPTEDNRVTIQEFQQWIVETEPEGWEGSDGVPESQEEENRMKKAVAKINADHPNVSESEKMTLILEQLEGGVETE